jgi:membrane protease YdiL (CAAX protease family)
VPVTSSRLPLRTVGRPVDVPFAVMAWLAAFVVGQTLAVIILGVAGADDPDDNSIGVLFAGVAATWIAYLAGAWWASKQSGSGRPVEDYRLRFAPSDGIGIPLGVLTQLVLLPLVYWPLDHFWPDTFSDDKLTETAERLVDKADGGGVVLLVLMVCVLAPIVEEIVYRGMRQGSFAGRFDQKVALVLAALWFAVIHFRPVEYPGLFVFALVVGAAFVSTGRLGLPIVTHVAFNATGLALAWR